jgi:hypothetical protein
MLLLEDAGSSGTRAAAAQHSTEGMLLRSGSKKRSAPPTAAGRRRRTSAAYHRSTAISTGSSAAAGEHSSASCVQQPLPKLQQLQISYCQVSTAEPILQLSRLISLTRLKLSSLKISNSSEQVEMQELGRALCTLLPRLPQLQDFELDAELDSDQLRSVVRQLSTLRSLSSLDITIPESVEPAGDHFAGLPAGLSRLRVADLRSRYTADLQPLPAVLCPPLLPQLSGLQELVLYKAQFYPSVLRCMTKLKVLQLEGCDVLPAGRDSAAEFLAAVGCMTDLEEMSMRGAVLDPDPAVFRFSKAPAAAYAALTASSKLRELVFDADGEPPLPSGALRHMFPKGRVLPHLTMLSLEGKSLDPEINTHWFVTAHQLTAAFAACPALRSLHICSTLKPGDLTPLLQLPQSVTTLCVGGVAFDDAAATVVAQLTHLGSLGWDVSLGLTDVGLQQLTALQGLTYLHMFANDSLSVEVLDDGLSLEDGGSGVLTLSYMAQVCC